METKSAHTGYVSMDKHGPVLTSIDSEVLDQGLLQFTRSLIENEFTEY